MPIMELCIVSCVNSSPRFRFYALRAPQNLILECRLPWCLSNFGRFLLVADHYSLSKPVAVSFKYYMEKTGSFFQEAMACHSASIGLEDLYNFFCQLHAVTLKFKFQCSFEECIIERNLEHPSAEFQEVWYVLYFLPFRMYVLRYARTSLSISYQTIEDFSKKVKLVQSESDIIQVLSSSFAQSPFAGS